MTVKTYTETIVYDEWGNPTITKITNTYTIESRDFQSISQYDSLNITDDGILKNKMRILFLKGSNKDAVIDTGKVITVGSEDYTVVEIREYEKHKEVICRGLE